MVGKLNTGLRLFVTEEHLGRYPNKWLELSKERSIRVNYIEHLFKQVAFLFFCKLDLNCARHERNLCLLMLTDKMGQEKQTLVL